MHTLIATVLLTVIVWVQSPNKMSYQAVIRGANNELVTTQGVGTQISSKQYIKNNGLMDITHTKIQTDAKGVTALEFTSGLQITYIANITNNVMSSTASSRTYTVGLNLALGGYIIEVGSDGKHGLVAALQDQSSAVTWFESNDICNNAANQTTDGANFKDWRLPTKRELNLMYTQRTAIDTAAIANEGAAFATGYYWSSTEYDLTNTWGQYFSYGVQLYYDKFNAYYVRAVRTF